MRVLLIHGLGRSPLSVFGLSQFLQRSGYRTELFGYSSLVESYAQIIGRLQEQLVELEADRYGIVAHSLGAVLVRSAFATMADLTPAPVILLGPPNQSPRIAQLSQRLSPWSPFTGECLQNLASPSFYQQLSPLKIPHTIIAGTAGSRGPWSFFGNEVNDGVLTLREMQACECDGQRPTRGYRTLMLPVKHTQMLNHPLVQQSILQILADAPEQGLPSNL
ncbi:alpha/beta hydrolase [Acaryochloris sp. IP29b_bin.148]|uniref:esterase/lipase family protein n=1 Tax=Acaryochloris sp. IP29b_bin.148 TaxID=2969218 RepID=UPI00262C9995|nr:alpha/beta hydrolase [Acaryochloris sp. IP29b_bin.148]